MAAAREHTTPVTIEVATTIDLPARPTRTRQPATELRKLLRVAPRYATLGLVVFFAVNMLIDWRIGSDSECDVEFLLAHPATRIVAFGPSAIKSGVNSHLFEAAGYDFYNYAANGAGASYTLDWYERLFGPHHETPELVILGVSEVQFIAGRLEREFAIDANDWPWSTYLRELARGELPRSTLLKSGVPLIKYRQRLWSSLAGVGSARVPVGYYRGFEPLFGRVAALDEPIIYRGERLDQVYRDFRTLVERIVASGAKLVLVFPPVLENGCIADYGHRDVLSEVAHEFDVPYLDYNSDSARCELPHEPQYFALPDHLNRDGATRFTRRLIADLESLGLLKGSRGHG